MKIVGARAMFIARTPDDAKRPPVVESSTGDRSIVATVLPGLRHAASQVPDPLGYETAASGWRETRWITAAGVTAIKSPGRVRLDRHHAGILSPE
jgi:hypothetical protein